MRQIRGVIHVGTGLQDTVGNIGANSIARAQTLRDHGLNVREYNTNGTHTWVAARPLLEDFLANAVFRSTETSLSHKTRGRVTFVTAEVAPIGTSQANPTGSVEFRRGDTVLDVARVKGDGTARLRLGPRDDTSTEGITAHYLGDHLFNTSAGRL
jgi:hypothetical protein